MKIVKIIIEGGLVGKVCHECFEFFSYLTFFINLFAGSYFGFEFSQN